MSKPRPKLKILISGGGTGGHVFPAIAIANQIIEDYPDTKIQFVGALGRLEMTKVPEAGYPIIGLRVSGLKRKISLENIKVITQMLSSFLKARKIIKKFKPNIAIGVGGYASLPTLLMASLQSIPIVLQEQNSFPGITNKILAKRAKEIYVAYDKMDRFFDPAKVKHTGNPVRSNLVNLKVDREEAFKHFNLDPQKKTILIVGGSLGARTLNLAMQKDLLEIPEEIQVIWQTGKHYSTEADLLIKKNSVINVIPTQFINRMDLAYEVADLIVSRAGAIAISELCLIKKPVILVPSPNVAEDHQTKNALALEEKGAAIMIRDIEAIESLIPKAIDLLSKEKECESLKNNISKLGKPNSTQEIVQHIIKLIEN